MRTVRKLEEFEENRRRRRRRRIGQKTKSTGVKIFIILKEHDIDLL